MSTSLLCYAVLAVASHPAAGLVISSALMAGAFAVAAVSGGELNPALTLALALGNLVHPGKGGTGPASSWLTLIACELLGACVAAGLYGVTHRRECLDEVKGRSTGGGRGFCPKRKRKRMWRRSLRHVPAPKRAREDVGRLARPRIAEAQQDEVEILGRTGQEGP